MFFSEFYKLKSTPFELILYFIFLVLLITLNRCFAGISRGFGLALMESVGSSLVRPIVHVLAVLGVFYLYEHDTLTLGVALLGLALAHISYLFFVLKSLKRATSDSFKKYSNKHSFLRRGINYKKVSESIQFTFLNTVTSIEKNADVLIVGMFYNAETVAIYSFCTRIYNVGAMSQAVLSTLFSARAARYYEQSDLAQLNRKYSNLAVVSVLISIVVFGVCFLFGRSILEQIGDGFGIGYLSLVILSVGGVIRASAGPANVTANMVGAQKHSVRIVVFSLSIGLVVMIAFTSKFGIEGTAVGFVLMITLRAFILHYILNKHYGIGYFKR